LSPLAASSLAAPNQASSLNPGGTRHAGSSLFAAMPETETGDRDLLIARRPASIARLADPRARNSASETSHRDDDAALERSEHETTRVYPAGHVPTTPDEHDADLEPRNSMWPLVAATHQRIARASSSSGAPATLANDRASRRSAGIDHHFADSVDEMESRLVAPAVATPALAPPAGSRFHFEPVASRRRTAAADPVVEVSIGRIEVRAAVERGADRSVRQSSAVMGLDEYLRTRARGGSR
jgi:hypothetical protein